VETLEMAQKIGKEEGLRFVYIGNVYGHTGENTLCPKCGRVVVARVGYTVKQNDLVKGKCKFCGYRVPGVWE
jgi:pyruvate formate lyase activating enzyme